MAATAKPRTLILLVFSPTRLAYKYFKRKSENRTRFAEIWPIGALALEIALAVTLGVSSPRMNGLVAFILGYIATSRILEIAWAYYSDSMGTLKGDNKTTALNSVHRIKLTIMSYISLIFLWAFLYFALPPNSFAPSLARFVDSLYFSGVTITTLGYGDILPHYSYAKLLCVGEVLTGIMVLVLALASYMAQTSKVRQPAQTIKAKLARLARERRKKR